MQLFYTLSIIDDLGKLFKNIGNFIWNIIITIKDTIINILDFIFEFNEWIKSYLNIFPNEVNALLLVTLTILIALLIYRFLR